MEFEYLIQQFGISAIFIIGIIVLAKVALNYFLAKDKQQQTIIETQQQYITSSVERNEQLLKENIEAKIKMSAALESVSENVKEVSHNVAEISKNQIDLSQKIQNLSEGFDKVISKVASSALHDR